MLYDACDVVAHLVAVHDAGLLRPGALLVTTFKAAGGYGDAAYQRQIAGLARLLEPYCEPGSSRLLHLFANRPRERTFVARARGGGGRGNATPPPGVAE